MKTGVIILAAGSSSRLGEAKQLLEIQGEKLIDRSIKAAQKIAANRTVVVLGANAELIQKSIKSEVSSIVINSEWKDGMGSSIVAGLRFLIEKEFIDQVILMLCDQPFVDEELLIRLIQKQSQTLQGIIASSYSGTLGVPALFGKKYFEELLALHGHEGAKNLIRKHSEDVAFIDFPLGKIDLDTPHDVEEFLKNYDSEA
ncbi:nucleotidyltransferase family protein [Algoriphagus vanfongensis]|uniref:nucleotidyltransferase family protein n=1 Tax=Algoriphagus vanfongensis TaxID=426371 RepID=UPI00040941ED|nr:nucleotidyltransferase family protein [Algoriphagus vanfongensis]